jgi:hypothetical protein
MIVEVKDGVHLIKKHNHVLVNLADTYYRNKRFVYITHRVNSYSVDPAIYNETSKIESLLGFAVVSKTPVSSANALVEKLFMKNKPFEIFKELHEAINWAKSICNK